MKILLIRCSSFGDILLITPVLTVLKTRYPDAQIEVLSYARFTGALLHHPLVHRIISLPKTVMLEQLKKLQFIRFFRKLYNFMKTLRRHRYDHIIDLHNSTDSALCALLAKGGQRTGHRSQLLTLLFRKRTSFPISNLKAREYAALLNLRIVTASGLLQKKDIKIIPDLSFHPGDAAETAASSFLKQLHISGKHLIGLTPSASKMAKQWPEENFIYFGKLISQESRYTVLVFGAPRDRITVQNICAGIGDRAIPVCSLSILVAFALFRHLDLLITNDTAALHAATALSLPRIALFGPSNSRKFAPQDQRCTIIKAALPCSPCRDKTQKKCSACMESITVRQVYTATLNRLKQGRDK